jgi:hypothetical protein
MTYKHEKIKREKSGLMMVSELIEILQSLPQDIPVAGCGSMDTTSGVNGVSPVIQHTDNGDVDLYDWKDVGPENYKGDILVIYGS